MSFKERYLKAQNEAWKGNVDALEGSDDPNIIIHRCAYPHGRMPDIVGVEDHKQDILRALKAGPVTHLEFSDFIEGDNMASMRFRSRHLLTGQIPGMPPPTGEGLVVDSLWLFHLKDGKIIEAWAYGLREKTAQ